MITEAHGFLSHKKHVLFHVGEALLINYCYGEAYYLQGHILLCTRLRRRRTRVTPNIRTKGQTSTFLAVYCRSTIDDRETYR